MSRRSPGRRARSARAIRLLAAVVAAALPASGCGDDPRQEARDRVDAYVERHDELMRAAAPDLDRANRTYRAYAQGSAGPSLAQDVADAERAVRRARDRLLALDAPPEARRLHARIVRYFDLNVEAARQTARLARYAPAAERALRPVARANRRLRAELDATDDPRGRGRALQRFTSEIRAVTRRLRRLRPPEVLVPAHTDQLRRLSATADLSADLRRAVLDEDAEGVARLVLRFRRAASDPGPGGLWVRQARAAYDRRLRRVERAYAAAQREQRRLEQSLR